MRLSTSTIPQDRRGSSRAFTLLEIMVVIALIGLLTGVLVTGSVTLLRDRPVTGEEQLRSVLTKVRRQATGHLVEVRLSFDAKKKQFVASSAEGLRIIPVEVPGEFSVQFVPAAKGNSILIGGDILETGSLSFITFYSDGTCSPFRAQLRTGGPARVMNFDPWTCAEMPSKEYR